MPFPSITVIQICDCSLNKTGCNYLYFSEALPFFLLLVDLSRATSLARFALSSTSQVICYFDLVLTA